MGEKFIFCHSDCRSTVRTSLQFQPECRCSLCHSYCFLNSSTEQQFLYHLARYELISLYSWCLCVSGLRSKAFRLEIRQLYLGITLSHKLNSNCLIIMQILVLGKSPSFFL